MNDDTPYNEFDEFDDFEPEDRELHDEYGDFRQSAYDRWRPAIAAFAVLLTVVAIAVVGNGDNGSNSESSNPDVVVESTNVPLVTVPLTRTLKTGMKGDDVLRVQQRLAALRFDPGPQDGVKKTSFSEIDYLKFFLPLKIFKQE